MSEMTDAGRQLRPDRRPLYVLVVEAVREMIDEQGLRVGDSLPSEPALARMFDVGRSTIREAMMHLENEGIVERRRGVGTILTALASQPHLGLERLEPLEHLAVRQGWTCGTKDVVFGTQPASEHVAQRLGISPGDPIVSVTRTKTRDGAPLAVMVSYVPVAVLSEEALQRLFEDSVVAILIERNSVSYARAEVSAVKCSAASALRLRVARGEPLVVLREQFIGPDNKPVAWNENFFIPDLIELEALRRLNRPAST